VPPKVGAYTKVHDVTSQKTAVLIFVGVRVLKPHIRVKILWNSNKGISHLESLNIWKFYILPFSNEKFNFNLNTEGWKNSEQ
jgi:hypothetical protein